MTTIWLIWLAAFLLIEGWALVTPRAGDTLSEHVWEWFGIARNGEADKRPISGSIRLRRFILLAFMAWLTLHFITGGMF